jgi:hypothetical protein
MVAAHAAADSQISWRAIKSVTDRTIYHPQLIFSSSCCRSDVVNLTPDTLWTNQFAHPAIPWSQEQDVAKTDSKRFQSALEANLLNHGCLSWVASAWRFSQQYEWFVWTCTWISEDQSQVYFPKKKSKPNFKWELSTWSKHACRPFKCYEVWYRVRQSCFAYWHNLVQQGTQYGFAEMKEGTFG